jgi:hypothetical protein
MSATGTSTLDFGTTPGTNYVTTTITGQATIASGSQIEAYLMADATADHNAYDLRLDGTFNVHWVWA